MQTVKLVPFELIIQIMDNACKEYGVKRSESQILDALLSAFPTALVQDKKYVAYDDVILFMDNWVKALKTKDFNFLTQRRGLRCDPVDIEEFIDSKEYLNQSTQIRPAIKTKMLELYDPTKYYPEVIMTGATGIGKDYMAYLIIARTLYELWCYYNPQVEFGLAAGTSMVIAIQSITKELAKKVTFDELVGTVLRPSKFFQEKYNWDKTVTTELRFPNNVFVRPFSGEDNSALGMAIFAACFPGEQEYLCVDGTYKTFDTLESCRIKTADRYKIYPTDGAVQSVRTKFTKKLYRLHFGETYIDCTGNQKFKDWNGHWIRAEECEGQRLVYSSDGETIAANYLRCTKVTIIRRRCYVYDIQEVPETHTVIVPTKDRSFHLFAHNCVNEMSFMKVVSKSKKAGNSANQEYNQAARIYRTLSRRIKGRFNKYGKVPGKMVLISSAKEEGDFISSRLNELESISPEERAKVFVLKMSQWESLAGLDRLTLETFLVEKGDNTKQSRIIKSREEALEEADVIEVPMDYYGEFEKDIDGALADIAGEFISGSRKKFIPYKEDILKAAQAHTEATGGSQLFLKDSIIFDKIVDPYNPDYSRIVNLEYIKDILTPNNQYAAHIDYGFTGDATGIAIGHIASYKLIQAAKVYDPVTNGYKEISNTHLPVFFIDGVLQVYASSGSEVDIDFIEGLIYYLKEHLNIQWVTFDSYESRSSIQGFKKRKMISGVVSTVSDLEPYTELKNAIKTNRILYPESEMLMKEIRELERTSSGKVDHTVTSTKDVSDSVAAVLHVLMRKAQNLKAGRAFSTEMENNRQSRELPAIQRRSRFARL